LRHNRFEGATVLELTGTWSRSFVIAAVSAFLLLAAAAGATYRMLGPDTAAALVAAGSGLLLVALLFVASLRLRRADDRVRLGERALEAVPHAVFVVEALEPGRPNQYVNPAYSELTGYGVAEAVSDGFDALAIFVDPTTVVALDRPLSAVPASRVEVRRRDGTTLTAKLELRSVPRSDGGRYLVGLLEELAAGERQADRVPDARLEPAPASAEPAGRAKDAFLSSLSHELRSPLNACVMWLDVLALAPQPDKLTKAVEAIKRNLARQTRLVNDLNDAAKISAGGLEVRREPLDLVALVNRNLDAWQSLAIGKQLSFHQSIEPSSATIQADPERLLQALNHLIENAVTSTPAGGRIELCVRDGRGVWIVEVEDTGMALSAEDAANLFVPLWRAPASAKARPGIGLGLAVAHHLIAKHGGTLTATSDGPGARFTLTLPLAATGDPETDTLSSGTRRLET
jgi:signal transduction histidine kinase